MNPSISRRIYPVLDHFLFLRVIVFLMVVFQLPGVEACAGYTFRYGRNPLMELPLAVNPSGCARSEPKACTHVKRCVLRYSVGFKPFISLLLYSPTPPPPSFPKSCMCSSIYTQVLRLAPPRLDNILYYVLFTII